MISSVPHPRPQLRNYNEGSRLRSPRDGDSVNRSWLKARTARFNSMGTDRQVAFLVRQVNRLRRRIIGGGATASKGGLYIAGEWDPAKTYPDTTKGNQAIVFFTPEGEAASAFYTLQAVPAGVSPDVGAPYWGAWPNSAPGMWM